MMAMAVASRSRFGERFVISLVDGDQGRLCRASLLGGR